MSKNCTYRWFLVKTRIAQKLSDCLVFRCSLLINRQLPVLRLSANCLDGLLMKRIVRWKKLPDEWICQMWGIQTVGIVVMHWQNLENRNMVITKLTFWAFVWQQFCPTGASTLPMMGKHVTPVGQAACPIPKLLLSLPMLFFRGWSPLGFREYIGAYSTYLRILYTKVYIQDVCPWSIDSAGGGLEGQIPVFWWSICTFSSQMSFRLSVSPSSA